MKKVRIGTGSGYWGDRFDAADTLAAKGDVDYIAFDYLAELTMSIMQKQKNKDPKKGYATDFLTVLKRILPVCKAKNIKLIASAGGVNPEALGDEIVALAKGMGINLKVALVTGDNIYDRLGEIEKQGCAFSNMENGGSFSKVKDRITNANVYLGAEPIVEALRNGAEVVITGRNTDTSLFLAPMIYELGWKSTDYDKLANGICFGHIIECGAQVSGGNFTGGWEEVPDLAHLGWPIAEVYEDGTATITKPDGTGGLVSPATVKEELLYEIGDPASYITPDVIADFSQVHVEDAGVNKVRVYGSKGAPPPETLKVSMGYTDGFKAFGEISYAWPKALKKARLADSILRERFKIIGLEAEEILTEFIGYNSILGPISEREASEPEEVRLRIGIRTKTLAEAQKLAPELPCLVTCGPPNGSGYNLGKMPPQEILAYWPALMSKTFVTAVVTYKENKV